MAFIIDDIINAIAAANAAAAQEKNARDAMGVQRDAWDPWMQAGRTSLADMMRMMSGGYDASQIANDPGFRFRMAEGQKALERSAAARGGLNSGGTMKSLARYSQGLASEEFGNRFNRLGQIAGMGHSASGNYANSMGQLYGALGNAQSAGHMAIGKGIGGALGSAVGLGLGGLGPGGWSLGNLAGNMFQPQGAIPQQGQPTGYRPNFGFGLNYGGG